MSEVDMGTNYYLVKGDNVCETCGHNSGGDELHIGKSSAGWCFALHVIPELGINNLEDWVCQFVSPGSKIKNEYGSVFGVKEMIETITRRAREKPVINFDYCSNHAEPSEFNLVRCKIDGRRCVGHGAGTWDLISGEFS